MKKELIKSTTCMACGTQYPENAELPRLCFICEDDRQYIPVQGQQWVSNEFLGNNFNVHIQSLHSNLYELKILPSFAIGQRAFLICSPGGNILWDCIPLLDKATIDFIHSQGGLKAIAFSHPHYYSNMKEWSVHFNCPVYIHQTDEQWVMNHTTQINYWSGMEKMFWDGIKIINVGGHFPGSSLIHIPASASSGSIILCGDSLYISRNKKHISVMYSYPNFIPLPVTEVHRILTRVQGININEMYGAFDYQNLTEKVKEVLSTSLEKYTAC